MYSEWEWLLGLVVFVWVLALTILVWQQHRFLRSLFPRSGERDIRRKFGELVKQSTDLKQGLEGIKKHLSEVEEFGLKDIQRVRLFRYNPYDDTGGDQSFTLALLDKRGNGVVVTSLHARSGTRVFAKPVDLGKGTKYQLSKEEEKAVEEAMES